MVYYCSHITNKLKEEWEKLVKENIVAGFHQSFAWSNFKQTQNWKTYKIWLFTSKDDKLVWGCSILEFSFSNWTNFLYIPEWPVLDFNNEDNLFLQWRVLETAIHSIISLNKQNQTIHLRIEARTTAVPNWFLTKFIKAPINLQPRHTQVLNLEPSEENILLQMKQKWRYNIRLAEKKDVIVKEIPLSNINKFHSLYKITFKRNKFEGKDINFFQNYIKNCGEFSKIFVAEVNNIILASAIIVYFGKRATYFYGASSNDMREYMAPNALHWHIIKDAKKNGYLEYDFWWIAKDENDLEHEWHWITKFKKKFGGNQLNFIWAYDYIIQKDLYEKFIKKYEST